MLVSRRIPLVLVRAAVVGILISAVVGVVPAVAGPTVTVRVVGESAMLPLTSVTLEKPEPASGCPANSANAAINLAVHGNWDHGNEEGSKGDFTETILGETHAFTNFDTWAVWIDNEWGGGICEDLLNEGDEVLLIADRQPPPGEPTVLPLVLSGAPTSVVAGVPFSVTVDAIHTRPGTFAEIGEGFPEPQSDATVSGGGSSVPTDGSGVATLTLALPGTYTITASRPGDAPSAGVAVCVRNSSGLGCGVQTTPGSSGSTSTSTPVASGVAGARYTGPNVILAKAGGVIDGHVYRHGSAPRLLQGTVSVPNGLKDVKLRLTRRQRHGGGKTRCSYYDGLSERFRAMRCGAVHGRYFSLGARPSVSYLLPSTLSPGRYVFDIQATDAAGDNTKLARGTSRIVFYVS